MSILAQPHFHNEQAALARLEAIVWPDGPHCPRCGTMDRVTEVRGKTARAGLKRCGYCKRQFTVKVGTVFESSHIPLHKWFQAAHLMASSKKGISSHQLHRILQITYKSAWFMSMRIREAMGELRIGLMGGEGQIVEADTTFIGGKEKNKHRSKHTKGNLGGKGKQVVHSLIERGGRARSDHVANVSGKTLRPVVMSQVNPKSALMTDEGGEYYWIGKEFARHEKVNHQAGEYVRGDWHSNTVEGYFATLKRGIIGTYHHVSEAHLKRYLAEFDFRYNEREALGVNDEARADKIVAGIVGKRLMYRDSLGVGE